MMVGLEPTTVKIHALPTELHHNLIRSIDYSYILNSIPTSFHPRQNYGTILSNYGLIALTENGVVHQLTWNSLLDQFPIWESILEISYYFGEPMWNYLRPHSYCQVINLQARTMINSPRIQYCLRYSLQKPYDTYSCNAHKGFEP